MKRGRGIRQVRVLLWLLCGASLLLSANMMNGFERSIADAAAVTRELEHRIAENRAVIARSAQLHRAERRAWADLAVLSTGVDRAHSSAEFIKNLERLASRLKLQIVSTNASGEMPAAKIPIRARLLPDKIAIVVRGRFPSVVRFVQELSRQRPLAELSIPRISVAPAAHSNGFVDSTIELTIYCLLLGAGDAPGA
jgi:hypothetical protein